MIPISCKLYRKDVSLDEIYENISEIIDRIDGAVSDYQVRVCRECKTKYVVEFNSFFSGDSDYPRYETYIPMNDSEIEAFRLIDKGLTTIMELKGPTLYVDKKSPQEVSVRWDGLDK